VIDAEGDIYVTGTGINFNDRYSTIKLRGTDGQLLWQAYDSAGAHDAAAGLALDGQGGVYITGASDPDGDQSNMNDNFYTVKRDADTGAQLWTHFYGLNCVGCLDVSNDVLVDSAGHVFVVGNMNSAPYSSDMILFLLDGSSGTEVDRGIVGGGTNETADGRILRLDGGENLYVGGRYYNYNTGAIGMTVMKYASLAGGAGDLDRDGDVDLGDYEFLYECLTGPGGGVAEGCGAADMDGDGEVNTADYGALQRCWVGP